MAEIQTKKKRINKIILYAVKLLTSSMAVYFLVNMAGSQDLWLSIRRFGVVGIGVVTFLYLLSQFVSTIRLSIFFRLIHIPISLVKNFQLYLIGMSYNLFLPGGIGGDGYKFMILKQEYGAEGKPTFQAILLERLCGLAAISILLCAVVASWQITAIHGWPYSLLSLIGYALAFVGVKYFFPTFIKGFQAAMGLSFIVQFIQIVAILFIAHSLGINQPLHITGIFLLSTLATAIPVFLGGVGAREMVFAAFATQLQTDAAVLISIALIFSFCTVLSAVPGLFLDWIGKSVQGTP
jgi:uncharacterized membrane protein YbhN (UPF0104 family)